MAAAMGCTMFVESRRPPRPTSSTATSTRARRNSSNAIAVVTSKKVGGDSSDPFASRSSITLRTSSDQPDEHGTVDGHAVDREALFEADEMRRGIAADLHARRAQRAVGHRRHRSFAVRTGDENAFEVCLRVAERRCQRRDVCEAELDAELLEAQQVLQRIHIYGSATAHRGAAAQFQPDAAP